MDQINVVESESQLSRLVEAIERGAEQEIVIARNGRPVARLVPVESCPVERRIGSARGQFEVPDDIDASNADIARSFNGGAFGGDEV